MLVIPRRIEGRLNYLYDWMWAKHNREKYRAQKRAYYHKRKHDYRMQISARNAVNNAVNAGKLERGSCETCGAPKAEAHHEDYSRPMDIVWLCRKHHNERHRATA